MHLESSRARLGYNPVWLTPWSSRLTLVLPEGIVHGKESTCKAGDPSLIPGLGRSAGEGIGYPLQNPWASLVGQLVKNLPAMQETWVEKIP